VTAPACFEPRVFAEFNPSGPPCPVCRSRAQRPTVLLPVPGTERGGIAEARQVHQECYELVVRMTESETKP
jgi:hypothetical protein